MKLIICLGNPGKEFIKTRHNFARIIIEPWLSKNDFSKFKKNTELKAEVASGNVFDKKIIVALPTTYMNDSGESVALLKNYFKIDSEDVIVLHDDLDIAFGRIKINISSGSAGHKGVLSIINILKTKDFCRLRLGLKTEHSDKIPSKNYVLQNFSKEESKHFPIISKMAGEALDMIVKGDCEKAMNIYN